MKIYVAGSSKEIPRVRAVMALIHAAGYQITLDWTVPLEEAIAAGVMSDSELTDDAAWYGANADFKAIQEADVLWLLAPTTPTRGAHWEAGIALGLGKPLLVTGEACRQTIFTRLAGAWLDNDDAGLIFLKGFATYRQSA